MKKYNIILLFITTFLFFIRCQKQPETTSVKGELMIDLANLSNDLLNFKKNVEISSETKKMQENYKICKNSYKKVEWAVAYYIPDAARFINGPALDELETAENKFLEPNGFQVIEEMIFPEYEIEKKIDLIKEINVLSGNITQVKQHINAISLEKNNVLDALKSDVYRITTLGITGFDSPIAQLSISEVIPSLIALEKYIIRINNDSNENKSEIKLVSICKEAMIYCQKNNDFNSFDRAFFIKNHLNKLSENLLNFQIESQIENVNRNNVVFSNTKNLFTKQTFNVNAFIPSKEFEYSQEKAQFGEKLFYDKNISANQDRNCASCHHPEKAFTDGQKTNISINGLKLYRNTPTLTYASLQNAQFWDLRQIDLEKQTMDVVENKDEMHGSIKKIIPSIINEPDYFRLFSNAFPNSKKPEEWQIQNAIASYVRSLNNFDSKFDNYMSGLIDEYTKEEKQGFNLFSGKAKCATCHFIPIFNGTVPPNFSKTEQEVIGTPQTKKGLKISEDLGSYAQHQMPQLKNAFKTPTLRNTAITAPYMHNGVFSTLEEVIDFYNKGGDNGLSYTVDNQTLPTEKLNLSQQEKTALIKFMNTLTDKKYQ